ncbi:hypothetical protein BMS3Bbin01_00760 [bacterium BMS3Bbin01]|nr:hypothetical protein BMS3Bbin01_00760 [bacterium BMS3Bbin01]
MSTVAHSHDGAFTELALDLRHRHLEGLVTFHLPAPFWM